MWNSVIDISVMVSFSPSHLGYEQIQNQKTTDAVGSRQCDFNCYQTILKVLPVNILYIKLVKIKCHPSTHIKPRIICYDLYINTYNIILTILLKFEEKKLTRLPLNSLSGMLRLLISRIILSM